MAEWIRGSVLGSGSSATVSLAISTSSDNPFAVKTAEFCHSDLLQREQRILSTLNCPQIISYLGFQVTPLHYNLFIEYAPDGSLSNHIMSKDGRLNDAAVRSHAHEILTGLAYLHSLNLVHCDIKPDNILIGSDGRAKIAAILIGSDGRAKIAAILIGSDGRAKIADLGCARWTNHAGDTSRYQMRGTPMFMAPEVARGEEQEPAADVWALGCTVLEMATGRAPWPLSDPMAALHQIAFSQVLPEISRWISEEGKDFLTKCLVRDPSQRWTVDQLLEHPFVDFSPAKQNLNSSKSSWRSPKSILDLDFWESESEEEEHKVRTDDHTRERMQELVGSCHGGPNWTWDESWTTIRSNTVANAVDDEVCVVASQISSNSSSSTEDTGNLLFESHNYYLVYVDSDEILEIRNAKEMVNVIPCKRDFCLSEMSDIVVVFGLCQPTNCWLLNIKYLGLVPSVYWSHISWSLNTLKYKWNLIYNYPPSVVYVTTLKVDDI